MKLRILSDIHLEFGDYQVESLSDDKHTVLILAGDITVVSSRVSMQVFGPFLQRCVEQFAHVIMVMGNHEHYHGDIATSRGKLEEVLKHFNLGLNVTILENETKIINGVAFIGATLWTDCGGVNNLKSVHLWHGMTDSKIVKIEGRPFSVYESRKLFDYSKAYILHQVEGLKQLDYKTVLVVHHLPSDKSTHEMYKGQDFNMFFKSDMDLELAEANPDLVVHGHTHHACDYMLDETICNTRVVCNPRGYHGRESDPISRGFNPLLTIEV